MTDGYRPPFSAKMSAARFVGSVVLALLPACAFCVDSTVHPKAIENASFCAQYVDEGNFTSARARCNIAIEYSPKYAEPYNLLGLIEYNLGRADRAREYFKQAISLKNDFAEAHNNLGAIFQDEGQRAAACDQFKQAIEIDPGYLAARLNFGNCLFHSEQTESARNEYLKCIEIDPNACDCRLGLGAVALREESYAEAKTHFQKMTEICPNDARGYYNLCFTYMQMNRCADAVDACLAVLKVDQNSSEARGTLVKAQECVALGDTAVTQWQEKIRQNPGDPELHFGLGVVYYEKRLVELALNEFLNTVKMQPGHKLAHYWAAKVYDDQYQATDTVNMCKRFVDLLRGAELEKEAAWCKSRIQELQYQ